MHCEACRKRQSACNLFKLRVFLVLLRTLDTRGSNVHVNDRGGSALVCRTLSLRRQLSGGPFCLVRIFKLHVHVIINK